uniref:Uncharacterized protein n=1 Tax=Kocuria rosea subsp. polaris TaxID=136273 RepID=A0A0A6VNY3_KOCRO|nr:hypothetical protein GY22_17310 [Kocuria polaris]
MLGIGVSMSVAGVVVLVLRAMMAPDYGSTRQDWHFFQLVFNGVGWFGRFVAIFLRGGSFVFQLFCLTPCGFGFVGGLGGDLTVCKSTYRRENNALPT